MKNYKMFTESEITDIDERDIIINILCPFYVKKYYDLIKWAKDKTGIEGSKLDRLIFEKRKNEWNVIVESNDWSNNSNRIITHILAKEYKNFAKQNGIQIRYVNEAAYHSKRNDIESVVYDVEKEIEI